MNKLRSWLTALRNWNNVELKLFWISLFAAVMPICILLRFETSDDDIRIWGLVFQILGLLTVGLGILKALEQFYRQPLLEAIKTVLRSFPKFSPQGRNFTVSDKAGHATSSARFTRQSGAGLNPTPEARIDALEENVRNAYKIIGEIYRDMDANSLQVEVSLNQIRQASAAGDEAIHQQIYDNATHGIHISALGYLWLFCGSILSTIPTEIHNWLN